MAPTALEFCFKEMSVRGVGVFAASGLGVALLFLLTARAAVTGTVTAHVEYSSGVEHNRPHDSGGIVLWLTPLLPANADEADKILAALPHRYRLAQIHKTFDPHLLIVPVGAVVEFPNRDPFFHNVFSLFEGKRFDLGLYEAGSKREVHFDRPGVSFIFCNIHPQMTAIVIAVKTPYFAVSDPSGNVEIRNVSPGRYRTGIWAERCLPDVLNSLSREVTVGEGTTLLGPLKLKASGDLLANHKNKYGRDYDTPSSASPLYDQQQ